MDPAPGWPGGIRQDIYEGGDIVVGDLLALVDRVDGEPSRTDGGKSIA